LTTPSGRGARIPSPSVPVGGGGSRILSARPRSAAATALAALGAALAAGAAAQDAPPERAFTLDQSAQEVTLVSRRPAAAPAALGALGGAVAAAGGGSTFHEDLLVLTSGPDLDARARVAATRPEGGRVVRQVYDVRAEAIVAFLGVQPADAERPVSPRALYAEGFVRIVVETGRGSFLLEAERVFLDLVREEALLIDGEVRGYLAAAGRLAGASPVARAERIRVAGPELIVADGVSLTGCDHGVPHFALTARRVELRRLPEVGEGPPPRLLPGLFSRGAAEAGSDALAREAGRDRGVRLEGIGFELLGVGVPFLPVLRWNTAWPLPSVRAGSSSRLGNFGSVGLRYGVTTLRGGELGELELDGASLAEYFERRGTGGEQGLSWTHRADGWGGRGHVRAYGIRDRADADRVGTPVPNEGRFWLRGLLRERLPGGVQVDAEASRVSDRGFLLEYFRSVAQTEKPQETYVYARWAHPERPLAARLTGRWRLNDFQDQVERLPELRLDWIKAPLAASPRWGGLYLDVAARAGHLRRRPDEAAAFAPDYRAGRGDARVDLEYKNALGPLVLVGRGGVRETLYSGGVADDDSIDRFAAEGSWNLSTVLWRRYRTPWTVLRHEVVPEVGTVHRFSVTRDPAELPLFDREVELVHPTDHVFLRVRTRVLADAGGRRRKLVDLAVEARYELRDRGRDRGRRWRGVLYDLRLEVVDWLAVRVRAEHDVNRSELVSLDASATLRPAAGVEAVLAYREQRRLARAVSWGVSWRLTPAWTVAFEQQYDLASDEFLFHRGRVERRFHRFALSVDISHDPQQDDTSASFSLSLAPLFDAAHGPFEADPYRGLFD